MEDYGKIGEEIRGEIAGMKGWENTIPIGSSEGSEEYETAMQSPWSQGVSS